MKKQNSIIIDKLSQKKEAAAGKRKGFTLIEVLVAVFLVGVAVMGLAQIFTLTVLNNSLPPPFPVTADNPHLPWQRRRCFQGVPFPIP